MALPAPTIARMPADFTPMLSQDAKRVFWRGSVAAPAQQPVKILLGFPLKDPQAAEKTRQAVWQVQEYARLNRMDLVSWARADRHDGHPVSKPTVEG